MAKMIKLAYPKAGAGGHLVALRKSLTAEGLKFGRRTTAADFYVNPMTVIEKNVTVSLRSSPGAHLIEIASVQPTVDHRRQCRVSGEQFELL